jgi:hypothetical protein
VNLLLMGETGSGALLQSLVPGMRTKANVTIVDILGPAAKAAGGRVGRMMRRADLRNAGARLIEAVRDGRPDAVLLIKGRGVAPGAIEQCKRAGVRVACYYPDNPWWTKHSEPGALDRLRSCDLTVTFTTRQATQLDSSGARTDVLPFGYDPRWYPVSSVDAERADVVFLGTWSRRRQRYLAALAGTPARLVVRGTGWEQQTEVPAGPPIYEHQAGALLARAAIGVNLLHPQCAGGHNMRTREITASGALQLTDPGVDGTPLVDGVSCRWFRDPDELRQLVRTYLSDNSAARQLAAEGQRITAADTYHLRGVQLFDLLQRRL